MAVEQVVSSTDGLVAIGAGLAIGLSAIGAGWAQAAIGSAGIGAAAERQELEGKILVWMVIPETLVILGFVIAFLIISMVGGGG